MKNVCLCLLLLWFAASCQSKTEITKQECIYDTDNPTLRIYNDVLIELVENRFYNGYLGTFSDSVVEASGINDSNVNEPQDTVKFRKQEASINATLVERHNFIFNKPDKWATVYLDTAWDIPPPFQEILNTFRGDSAKYKMREWLKFDTTNWDIAYLDTLAIAQKALKAEDFQSCTFKVAPISDLGGKYLPDMSVVFSKVILHQDQKKAWLYYSFFCDPKCGFGEVLHLEKVGQKWKIQKSVMLWIS